ncbi:hypothetical protein AB0940_28950, partial [Streptomyces sp. NPDC006656]|uniref:hypothetical protein n=1 Tax=Streptomyces sp. NPDC006656 TaxID=3156899 RepID=UPI0034562530
LAGVRAALESARAVQLDYDPLAGVRSSLESLRTAQLAPLMALKFDPLAGVRAALESARAVQLDYDPLAGVRSSLESLRTAQLAPLMALKFDPLAEVRAALASVAAAQLDPLAGVLGNIARQALGAYPLALLEEIVRRRSLWLPENLRHLKPAMWPLLFRVSVKDGVCLTWAPRSSIVDELLHTKTSRERHQLLLDRRQEVVADVLESLEEVVHPELQTYGSLTAQAAACIEMGQEAAAQALLGNILDSVLRAYGSGWFEDQFGSSGDTNHKLVHSSLARRGGQVIASGSTRLGPYLLVASLKNAFDGRAQQGTFNRNLTVHKVRDDTYRPEFAVTTLLVVQSLLRQIDGYLCTEPDRVAGESADDGTQWEGVLKEALTVFGALNRAAGEDDFRRSVEAADPDEYRDKRVLVMQALNSFRNKLPPVYGPAPACETCNGPATPGTAEARCGKPGTFWWCGSCSVRLGDRKPL